MKNKESNSLKIILIFLGIFIFVVSLTHLTTWMLMDDIDKDQLNVLQSLQAKDVEYVRVFKKSHSPNSNEVVTIKNPILIKKFCKSLKDFGNWPHPQHPHNPIKMTINLKSGYQFNFSIYFYPRNPVVCIASYKKWGILGRDFFEVRSLTLYSWLVDAGILKKLNIIPSEHPAST